jgi:hypothetical protein
MIEEIIRVLYFSFSDPDVSDAPVALLSLASCYA